MIILLFFGHFQILLFYKYIYKCSDKTVLFSEQFSGAIHVQFRLFLAKNKKNVLFADILYDISQQTCDRFFRKNAFFSNSC